MVRPEDPRSPSPVGSNVSSRRSRRDDDRPKSRREDDRHYQHPHHRDRDRDRDRERDKQRSRSPERRRHDYDRSHDRDQDRDRDSRRHRDRSLDRRRDDRYRDDRYYSSRRDRSRDRRRSRDRGDRRRSRSRDRDRDLDHRSRKDDPRVHDRPRDRDRERDRDRDRERERNHPKRDESTESKKRKRQDSRDPSSRRDISSREGSKPVTTSAEDEKAARLKKLEEWKRKQAAAVKSQDTSPQTSSPAQAPPKSLGSFTAPKPAVSTQTKKPLGADLDNVPAKKVPQTVSPKPVTGLSNTKATSLKAKGNLSGFSLSNKPATEADAGKSKSAFEDDDDTRKKLEKLPTLLDVNGNDQADTPQEEDDEDDEMPEGATEEEALAAARAAAERRQAERTEDATMVEAPAPEPEAMEVEHEDIDPLDAFMQENNTIPAKQTNFKAKAITKGKNKSQEPQAFFDDDGVDITAMQDENDPDAFRARADEIAKKKKKDIGTVNHAKMQYEPFRKNFYSEPVEMQDWDENDVAGLRMELDSIKIKGADVPKPVQTWAQCGLGVQVLECIRSLEYAAPTSIQAQAIPAVMSGRDVIGVAKTGSGKTIAFLLPMFRHIKDQRPLDALDGPIGLILSPTRELATQIHKDCKPFLKALGMRAVCAYGGAPIKDQIADFKRGAEIVVATPGRLIDLLAANSGRVTNLRRVTYVVLDEADRMFDMGFEPQMTKILLNIRPDRQTVLFSATFPKQMEQLARKILDDPVEIVVGGRSVVAPEITQIVEVRAENTKFIRLLELLGQLYEDEGAEDDRVLIFVDRQEAADSLLRDLMKKGYPCMSLHGGKDQIDRDSTIEDFKAGVVPILIATSVAARGLDVKQLKLVVNYEAPNHLEDYVHRAGRTGRAGNKGTAVTFITEEQDRYAVDISKALKQSGQPVPEAVQKLVDGFLEKVKAGKEKGYAGGFGGKGLERLDQQRDADKARERKAFKTGDEPDQEDTADKEDVPDAKVGDDIFAKAASNIGSRDKPASPTPTGTPGPSSTRLPGVPDHIDLDGVITVHKTERPAQNANTNQSQMDKVAAAVANINSKLSKAGVMRSGVPIDNKGPDAGAFHATLEINDFPQRARWGVTNRTNVAKILDSTGTSITTKGSFYPTGKTPGPNDNPKLYILVEGDTEVVVQNAMRELMRLLKEGTLAAAEGGERVGGRYSVV